MPTPPTLRNTSQVSNPTIAGTSKTVSLTCSVGDVLVLGIAGEDVSSVINVPTGGTGVTWTLKQSVSVVNDGTAYLYTATATAANTAATITMTAAASTKYTAQLWVWDGATTAGIGNTAKANNTAAVAPSCSITTTQANSALCYINGDFNAVAITTRTWRTINGITPTSGNGLEVMAGTSSGSYSFFAAHWTDAGAIGTYTTGMTAPASQAPSIVVAEVLPAAAAGGPNTPVISRPLLPRLAGSALTFDHGVMIQAPGADVPNIQVAPYPVTRPPVVGSVLVISPRADPPVQGMPSPPVQLIGKPAPQAPPPVVLGSRADPAPNQPVPLPVVATARPGPVSGSTSTVPPRSEPSPAQNQPTPVITLASTVRSPAPAAAVLASAPHVQEPGTAADVVVAGGRTPAAPGSSWNIGSRTDPLGAADQPAPAPVVAPARTVPPASATTVLTPRAEPNPAQNQPIPATEVTAGRPPAYAGGVQVLGPRTDATVQDPPVEQPLLQAGRPPALAGSSWTAMPRSEPSALQDQPVIEPVVVTVTRAGSPGSSTLTAPRTDTADTPPAPTALVTAAAARRPAGSALSTRLTLQEALREAAPSITVLSPARPGGAPTAVLTRPTFTGPAPVVAIRPPLVTVGRPPQLAGMVRLLRLAAEAGHVCPPPTPRPDSGITARPDTGLTLFGGALTGRPDTGSTFRPNTGITPIC